MKLDGELSFWLQNASTNTSKKSLQLALDSENEVVIKTRGAQKYKCNFLRKLVPLMTLEA